MESNKICLHTYKVIPWSITVVPGPAASALPGNLQEMQVLMPYPGPNIRNSSICGLISLPSVCDVH